MIRLIFFAHKIASPLVLDPEGRILYSASAAIKCAGFQALILNYLQLLSSTEIMEVECGNPSESKG